MTNQPESEIRSALLNVRDRLQAIEQRMLQLETEMESALGRVPLERRASARNLVHYIALRQQDLRDLQVELADLGLSSLGRLEGCVLGTIRSVLMRTREALAWRGDVDSLAPLQPVPPVAISGACALDWSAGMQALHHHTRELLGPKPEHRHVYIMVTAPSASEGGAAWMECMLRAGMNVLRINCAHEGPEEWERLVRALRQASERTEVPCRILMDLAGPKIRTGAIQGALRVATWKPDKDQLGRVVSPAKVRLKRASAPRRDSLDAELVLGDEAFSTLRLGDTLEFRDTRGK
ncbi:MAG: pyruvate kinase, partial [Polyangiaceae bacterium]